MKHYFIKLLFVLLLPLSSPMPAAGQSWLMSIPYAVSSEHIYKVVIESIDGQPSKSAIRYPLTAGEHTITVSLKLDVEWSPDLVEAPGQLHFKQIKISAEDGKTYQIAGRLDISAPAESQLDGSFWEPIVYQVLSD
jgi:hypothetical protein